jgi:Flp pilus assembly protein TadG
MANVVKVLFSVLSGLSLVEEGAQMKTKNMAKVVRNERGISAILIALVMFALIGIVGLALDVGYAYLAKTELQNAADAGALAGVGTIYPANSSSLTTLPSPDFTSAQATATSLVKKNKSVGANLTDADIVSIQAGYWNINQVPAGIQPQSTVPTGKCSASGTMCTSGTDCPGAAEECLIQDIPAVQVTVQKSGVPTFFAKVLGWNSFSPAATAVAATGYPLTVRKVFPVAVTKCMTDYYFSHPQPNPPPEIYIWGPYGPQVPGCDTGQWTSLTTGDSSVSTMRGLMDGSISAPIDFGTQITIEPGTKDTLYQEIQKNYVGQVVEFPVVADVTLSLHDQTPVVAFVAFQIDGAITSGANKQIYGHFLAYYRDPNASHPGGPRGNTVTPPVLVK